jgi:hypothetical protein
MRTFVAFAEGVVEFACLTGFITTIIVGFALGDWPILRGRPCLDRRPDT